MYATRPSIFSSLRAGLPPLGGISIPVVFAGSLEGRPVLIRVARSESDIPAMNSVSNRLLPRPATPVASAPWQPAHVPKSFSPDSTSSAFEGPAGFSVAAGTVVAVETATVGSLEPELAPSSLPPPHAAIKATSEISAPIVVYFLINSIPPKNQFVVPKFNQHGVANPLEDLTLNRSIGKSAHHALQPSVLRRLQM